ncbi:MAG TPA: L-threonylcarbamoyladenylate synthase [Syntrophales bacterium]|nr:L-threonylcarbamoyladenylate synthase [Syntrophales bacterium]HOX94918.1 L-threonylcarbamoyladenylate synthase [Syntrophales bacterium]HPI58254.1 L-threonylcarbamoyladenylate synthase [Syntrophales bacterium]HPN25309.1 L-threonylcarbamoyladenylate synthase [Syntrophales bacterium]HQM29601.1 L-threonylcarbamoyladenylate synthase [Syntrophales bacterium]
MSILIKINPENPEPEKISETLAILKRGGVIAFPTETFYGLGADAGNESAIRRIFEIKGRDFRNPIPLIIEKKEVLPGLVKDIPALAETLMTRFWPGPLTLVFEASRLVHPGITAGTGKVGIRISSHPVATALAAALGGLITATSANLSGKKECSSAGDVLDQIGGRLDGVVDGGLTAGGLGSTILDVTCDPPRIFRHGAIPASRLHNMH